jgi:hypothetical protein
MSRGLGTRAPAGFKAARAARPMRSTGSGAGAELGVRAPCAGVELRCLPAMDHSSRVMSIPLGNALAGLIETRAAHVSPLGGQEPSYWKVILILGMCSPTGRERKGMSTYVATRRGRLPLCSSPSWRTRS